MVLLRLPYALCGMIGAGFEMEKYGQITLHSEKRFFQEATPPSCHRENVVGRELEIIVIFTSTEATLSAIDRAGVLLSGLRGRISLVDAEIVPYPLPLDSPPVALDFTEQRLLAIANQSMFEMTVSIYLCRSRLEALLAVLKRSSVVIIGCYECGPHTWEKKLAQELQRAGIQTILLGTGARVLKASSLLRWVWRNLGTRLKKETEGGTTKQSLNLPHSRDP